MKHTRSIVGMGLVAGVVVVVVVACGGDDGGATITSQQDSGTTLGTDSSVGTGDSAVVDAALSDGAVADSGDAGDNCPTPLANEKLVDLNDPVSPKKAVVGAGVHLTGAVVTSAKFLVQKTSGGTCTYGVFVADALATFAPYSGILVLARGADAKTTGMSTFCDNGDLIPTDVAIGDIVDLKGTYAMFGPAAATCPGATPPVPAKMAQLAALCSYKKTGKGAAPLPLVVTPAELVTGVDVAKYAGGLVKVTNVTAKTATAPGDATFGNFTLDPSNLQIGDGLYYRGAATAPTVTVGETFTEIAGISRLDFCTWSLAPRTICDFKPAPPPGSSVLCP